MHPRAAEFAERAEERYDVDVDVLDVDVRRRPAGRVRDPVSKRFERDADGFRCV